MVVADSPAASGPSSTGSASAKSPVDNPRRYSTGNSSLRSGPQTRIEPAVSRSGTFARGMTAAAK